MSDQVLRLTARILKTEKPTVYVGYIQEISGIIAQASSEEEVHKDLEFLTGRMLLEHKREEALRLLEAQTQRPAPALKSSAVPEYEIEYEAVCE